MNIFSTEKLLLNTGVLYSSGDNLYLNDSLISGSPEILNTQLLTTQNLIVKEIEVKNNFYVLEDDITIYSGNLVQANEIRGNSFYSQIFTAKNNFYGDNVIGRKYGSINTKYLNFNKLKTEKLISNTANTLNISGTNIETNNFTYNNYYFDNVYGSQIITKSIEKVDVASEHYGSSGAITSITENYLPFVPGCNMQIKFFGNQKAGYFAIKIEDVRCGRNFGSFIPNSFNNFNFWGFPSANIESTSEINYSQNRYLTLKRGDNPAGLSFMIFPRNEHAAKAVTYAYFTGTKYYNLSHFYFTEENDGFYMNINSSVSTIGFNNGYGQYFVIDGRKLINQNVPYFFSGEWNYMTFF